MTELLKQLEAAIARRNPLLVQHRLDAPLTESKIRKDLARAGVAGAIDPIVALYSWHNGCELHGEPDNGLKPGFTPPKIVPLSDGQKAYLAQYGVQRETDTISYHFLRLRTAIVHFKDFAQAGPKRPRLAPLGSRYFPFLWNGSTWNLAVDTDPAGHTKVIAIESQQDKDPHALRHAYHSFEDFLNDAIRANDDNDLLTCLKTPGTPLDASAA